MKKYIFIIIILLILVSNCDKETRCLNEKILIETSKERKIIKLNYNQDQERLIEDIEKLFEENICEHEKSIGLELSNQKVINTIFKRTCRDGVIPNHIRKSEIKILMNDKGQILINSEHFMEINSIEDWIGENFPNKLNFGVEEIFFLWGKDSPKNKIELVFIQIEKGYLKSYNKLSINNYGKDLCELNQHEILELKNDLKYRIKLGFGKINIPPPPPPEN